MWRGFLQGLAAKQPSDHDIPKSREWECFDAGRRLAVFLAVLAASGKFTRQIVPPVIATLIAAVLIAAYNNMFSGHLQQPRMAALHAAAEASTRRPACHAGHERRA